MDRDGHSRATGPFGHPNLAGTFGGILFPLFLGLWWKEKKDRKYAALGMAAAIVIPFVTNSSTALFGLIAGMFRTMHLAAAAAHADDPVGNRPDAGLAAPLHEVAGVAHHFRCRLDGQLFVVSPVPAREPMHPPFQGLGTRRIEELWNVGLGHVGPLEPIRCDCRPLRLNPADQFFDDPRPWLQVFGDGTKGCRGGAEARIVCVGVGGIVVCQRRGVFWHQLFRPDHCGLVRTAGDDIGGHGCGEKRATGASGRFRSDRTKLGLPHSYGDGPGPRPAA